MTGPGRRGRASLARIAAVAVGGLGLPLLPGGAQAVNMGELVDHSALRVCADPADLPFSNDQRAGFENKIAELLAAKLGVPVDYTWWPQSMGFVRNTLRANRCDLIVGVVATDELVQSSNPYYRSSYVLAARTQELDRFGDIDSPLMAAARIGVVAGTPPTDLLVRKGLTAQMRPYQLLADTRIEQPARRLLEDLARGEVDVALIWGPIAGYWAKQQSVPITLVPLKSDVRVGLRMDFRIAMGIRPNEPEWKSRLNGLIRELQPQIQAILQEYGVPMLDERGNLIGSGPAAAAPQSVVPEPSGYRMDEYRAPVPATLAGATVLGTAELERLIAERQPVLIDVFPKQRKPENRDQSQVWIEPKREHIAGSVWLPNVGFGELSPDFAGYFRDQLASLTGGDKGKPVVFYCDTNCWMSWNAAKRAMVELGYTAVYWYPEGIQGWQKAGQQMAEAQEIPMPAYQP